MSKRHLILVAAGADRVVEEMPGRGRSRTRKGEKAPQPSKPERGEREQRGERYTKNLTARTEGQQELMTAIDSNDLVLALGPAGSGKTYLAVGKAVELLRAGKVQRIILARPAVEAGERLGFMPGDANEKLDPYMRPLYDALFDWVSPAQVSAWMAERVIEIAPIAFMRGRTLKNAAIVVDEAQNATRGQLKMILTRLGFGSVMIITGDPGQNDLDEGDSGLNEVAAQLEGKAAGVAVVRLGLCDIVRHPLVRAILPLLEAA